MIKQKSALMACLFSLVLAGHALADWPDDPLINIPVSTVPGEKNDVFLVTDGTDGALVAWEDSRSGQADIYLQRLSAEGLPLWTAGGIPVCNAPDHQSLYHSSDSTCGVTPLVADGQGGVFLVWQDSRQFSQRQRDIYCQRVDGEGHPLWISNGLAVAIGAGNEDQPTMCSDGFGGVIIVWQDKNDDPVFNNLYGQRLDSDGRALWNGGQPLPINTLDWDQGSPALCPADGGGAFLVWSDNQLDVSDLYAQRLGLDGQLLWPGDGVPLAIQAGNQSTPVIMNSEDGNPIVAWRDHRNGDYDIYTQKLSAEQGSPLWNPSGLAICSAANSQYRPSLCTDGQAGCIVAWFDYRAATGPPWNLDIYAQRVLAAGTPAWTLDGEPVCTAPDAQRESRLISDGHGGALVAWEDNRTGTGREDIYAQHLDAEGLAQWIANGVPICLAAGHQKRPNLVLGASGAILAWPDDRHTLYVPDIYGDRVIIQHGSSVPSPAALPISLTARPNPFNPRTVIRFKLPRELMVQISLHDLAGHTLATLLPNTLLPAGPQEISWDGSHYPAGMYLVQLKTPAGAYHLKITLVP